MLIPEGIPANMASPKALKLRTDCISNEVDQKVLEFIRKLSPCHFVVQHNADKETDAPHWHAIMWTQREAQSVRVHLLKAVPELKRKYSLGAVGDSREDYEAYERYMCHGDCEGDTVRIISAQAAVHHAAGSYTQAWAQEQNRKFYQVQRAFVREKKHKKVPVIDKIIAECQERNALSVTAIGQVIVDLYTKERRMMNVYNMKSQLRTVMCVMNGSVAKRTVLDEITQGLVEPQNIISCNSTTVREDLYLLDNQEDLIESQHALSSDGSSEETESVDCSSGEYCSRSSEVRASQVRSSRCHYRGGSRSRVRRVSRERQVEVEGARSDSQEDRQECDPSVSASSPSVHRRQRESASQRGSSGRLQSVGRVSYEDRPEGCHGDSCINVVEAESGHGSDLF